MKSRVGNLAQMRLKVRLDLMGRDFGSRFDDSSYYSKGHSVGGKKVRKEKIKY